MKIIQCEQYTKEWAEARRGVATASSADRIITAAKGELSKQAESYACELVAWHLIPNYMWLDGGDFQSEAMANGTRTEKEARAFFELETGLTVREVGFIKSDCGRAGCSPDGLVGEGESLELLELKCPLHKTQVRYLADGVLPVEYKPQVHWALAVTGCRACHFMSYAPGLPPLVLRIEPDEYTKRVEKLMGDFWKIVDSITEKVLAHRREEAEELEAPNVTDDELRQVFPLTG